MPLLLLLLQLRFSPRCCCALACFLEVLFLGDLAAAGLVDELLFSLSFRV